MSANTTQNPPADVATLEVRIPLSLMPGLTPADLIKLSEVARQNGQQTGERVAALIRADLASVPLAG